MNAKKIGVALLAATLIFGTASTTFSTLTPVASAAQQQGITVLVNGKKVSFPDAQPYSERNRVMIPIRFVSEALGAKVTYQKTQDGARVRREVGITLDDSKIYMNVNSDTVLVNDRIVKIDVPARAQQDRVYVPLRFVSEALGANVGWSQANRQVTITTKDGSTTPTTPPKDTTGFYQDWEFRTKDGYTALARKLFVDNMKIASGKVTFTLPKGAKAMYEDAADKRTELEVGKTYTYAIGKDKGRVSIILPVKGAKDQEGYIIMFDSSDAEGEFDGVKDAIVEGNGNSVKNPTTGREYAPFVADTLTNVLVAAQKLK